jgi:D-galactarolactone cycloisomerase
MVRGAPLFTAKFRPSATLRAPAPIPIATGEAVYTSWDFKRLLDQRAIDVVQPNLSMCGFVRVGREIARDGRRSLADLANGSLRA